MSLPCVKLFNDFPLHLEWNPRSLPGLLISDTYLPCNVILSSFYFTKLPNSFLSQGTCICFSLRLEGPTSSRGCFLLIIQVGPQYHLSQRPSLSTQLRKHLPLTPIPNCSLSFSLPPSWHFSCNFEWIRNRLAIISTVDQLWVSSISDCIKVICLYYLSKLKVYSFLRKATWARASNYLYIFYTWCQF